MKVCVWGLHSFGVEPSNITLITVSGMLEVTMVVRRAQSNYSTILVLGIVLRGQTAHSLLVTNVSTGSLSELQLLRTLINSTIPVDALYQLLNKVKHQSQYIVMTLLETSNATRLLS